mgnify:CR=1 FL=1
MRQVIFRVFMCMGFFLGLHSSAGAVPGPDSVAVIANKNIPESIALGKSYIAARQVPKGQLCLLDLPNKEDITLVEYQSKLLKPFEACLNKNGVLKRIEAVLLIRGVPLRVTIPKASVSKRAPRISLAAALGIWKSTQKGKPVLGFPSLGFGSWVNKFTSGPFFAGKSAPGKAWSYDGKKWAQLPFIHKPMLVTMLHGRTYKDAGLLLKSALDAEKLGGAKGQFLLMKGADKARAALDVQYTKVLSELKKRGFTDVAIEPFKTDRTGKKLAAFVTGTAGLKTTIEGNTFLPGSLTDNLTSYGALPLNFRAKGESQVSISRWVAKGVAGAHGTTDEPLNNAFPNRMFLVDYVDGSTLAESYHRRIPFAYWQNLVLGDPMAAPYALRPKITIQGVKDKDKVAGAKALTIEAIDPGKRGIATLTLYLNGKQIAQAKGPKLTTCLSFPVQENQLLVVAQAALPTSPNNRRKYQPKGWVSFQIQGQSGGSQNCSTPERTPEVSQEITPEQVSEVSSEMSPKQEPGPDEDISPERDSYDASTEESGSVEQTKEEPFVPESVRTEPGVESTADNLLKEEPSLDNQVNKEEPFQDNLKAEEHPFMDSHTKEKNHPQDNSANQETPGTLERTQEAVPLTPGDATDREQVTTGCGCDATSSGGVVWLYLLLLLSFVFQMRKRI